MKKTPFQIGVTLFVLFSFLFGVYTLYPTMLQIIQLLISGDVTMNLMVVLTLFIYLIFIAAHILLLVAAIHIYRSGSYKLLRVLLYASIPSLNFLGYLQYSYSFGPFLIFGLGLKFSPISLGFEVDANTFAIQYLLTFSNDYQSLIQVGVNVVPILFLWILNRWGKA